MPSRLLASLLVVALLVPMLACPARADDRNLAKQAFHRASQHYKLGEFKAALDEFKAAYRAHEDPIFLFNIAQCERQLDQREEAVREYKMYLAEAPDAPNREDVRAVLARLEQEIADQHKRDQALAAEKATPPVSVLPPASTPAPAGPTAANEAALTAAAPAPARIDKPAYKKWWVWTLVGVVVAGGAAAGIAVALTSDPKQHANTTLGIYHF